MAGGRPVAQKNFVYTDSQQDTLAYCLKLIEDASTTHYIGIFAHRLGYVPRNVPAQYNTYQGYSITQAEYYHAREKLKNRIAVFVPRPGSPFDTELKERASTQSSDEFKVQQQFIGKVFSEALVNLFDDITNLAIRVAITVMVWRRQGPRTLMQYAADEHSKSATSKSSTATPLALPTISANDVSSPTLLATHAVGRRELIKHFRDAHLRWTRDEDHPGVCFMIYGPETFGHGQMVDHICIELGHHAEVLQLGGRIIHLGKGQRKDIAHLLFRLSGGGASAPHRVTQLLPWIKEKLNDSHLLIALDVTSIAVFEQGARGFMEQFWVPLVRGLREQTPHSLVLLLLHRGESLPADWNCYWEDEDDEFDPVRIVKLPALEAFSQRDILKWLTKHRGDKPNNEQLAEEIFAATNGRPEEVYRELAEIELDQKETDHD